MNRTALGGLALGLLVSLAGRVAADRADWMTDEGGVLELKLALAEKAGVCGTALKVDRNKKLLFFEGAPGPRGCTFKLEARFEDVASVKTAEGAGFLLELKTGKPNKLLLIPVPHFQWLLSQPMVVTQGGLDQSMQAAGLRGPGGDLMRPTGSAAGAASHVERVPLPKEVTADTEAAARAVRAAVGE